MRGALVVFLTFALGCNRVPPDVSAMQCAGDLDCTSPATCGGGGTPGACGCPDSDGDGDRCSDCDDTNPRVSSSTAETCNLVDDDCDGEIDEGVQQALFEDAD